jgi:phosphotransferase system  glucose/maltose/N-acetylglucosamine-specific IIC component
MYRRLFKFAVTTITILTVNLITSKISDYLIFYKYKTHIKTVTFTLLVMGIVVLIFYPLFTMMKDWLNSLSAYIIKSGKSIAGKYLGLLLMFLICLAILLYLYAKMWYNVDIIKIIFQGRLGSQI